VREPGGGEIISGRRLKDRPVQLRMILVGCAEFYNIFSVIKKLFQLLIQIVPDLSARP
jgi:hypothetical protein